MRGAAARMISSKQWKSDQTKSAALKQLKAIRVSNNILRNTNNGLDQEKKTSVLFPFRTFIRSIIH